MVDLIRDLRVQTVSHNLQEVREQIAAAGRDPDEVEILAAVKYLAVEELETLREAGVRLLGENRAQDLVAKSEAYPGSFTWDFIGALQSRKVRQIIPRVRLIHSVASESALAQLVLHGDGDTQILLQLNISGEPGKAGIDPAALPGFLERSPVTVAGLMTMPPLAARAEDSRPYFRALRELAERHELSVLSMGTSQDFRVAVQEGATIIRLGTMLYRDPAPGAS